MQTKTLYRLASLFVMLSLLISFHGAASAAPLATDWQPTFPIRAAFYYPWFPEAWTQQGIYPYTNYTPSLGYYSSYDSATIQKHIKMMQYGNIQAGIASWWGQGQQTDTKIAGLLSAASGTNFRWALYYEMESQGDPTVSQIQNDLTYIRDHYGSNPNFLRVNGKFVVFVYAAPNDACGMSSRWKQANTVGAYVVLKVFPGFANCASQPDSWHQYSPAVAADQQGKMSFAISPGFWLKGQSVRLGRDLTRWTQNVKDMVASGANWQLVTTFNEWGEGTAVESATQWASSSGYGKYLDVLHSNGSSTTTSQSITFKPSADTFVQSSNASANYGGSTTLRMDASSVANSYLHFTVQGLNGRTISKARLQIYANTASSAGLVAHSVSSTTWGEMTMTYSTAPALGGTLATSPAVTGGTWVTLDVTSYVTKEGTFSFGISTPGSTAISAASRESGANAPKLIVTVN